MQGALAKADLRSADLAAVGVANQRETALIWSRRPASPCTTPLSGWIRAPTRASNNGRARMDRISYARKPDCRCDLFLRTEMALAARHIPARKSGPRRRIDIRHDRYMDRLELTGGGEGGLHVTDVTTLRAPN